MISQEGLLYGVTMVAQICAASAAVLESGRKKFDLFGMLWVGFVAAVGGGTVRDVVLGRSVFWMGEPSFVAGILLACISTFFVARILPLHPRLFLLPDAGALALFAVAGVHVAYDLASPLIASMMGIVTAVLGGILRDVLCNEEPIVFRGSLYGTAAWLGTLVYLGGRNLGLDVTVVALTSGMVVFSLRWTAIRHDIMLPSFYTKI